MNSDLLLLQQQQHYLCMTIDHQQRENE